MKILSLILYTNVIFRKTFLVKLKNDIKECRENSKNLNKSL